MMKKIAILLLLVLFGTGVAQSTPLPAYYTFNIEVQGVTDAAGLFAAGGVFSDTYYDFTLLMTPTVQEVYTPGPATWWEYDILVVDGPAYYSGATGATQTLPHGPGFDNGEGYLRFGGIVIGDTIGPFVDQWTVGMTFTAGDTSSNSIDNWWGGVATLTSISTVESVPEPASIVLFSTGLVGLLGARRRRK